MIFSKWTLLELELETCIAASRVSCSSWLLFGSFIAAWLCWVGNGDDDDIYDGGDTNVVDHVLAEGISVVVDHFKKLLHGGMKRGNNLPGRKKKGSNTFFRKDDFSAMNYL